MVPLNLSFLPPWAAHAARIEPAHDLVGNFDIPNRNPFQRGANARTTPHGFGEI